MSDPFDGFKPPQVGLVDMGDIRFYVGNPTNTPIPFGTGDLTGFEGLFSEMVLNVTWLQLQPTPGSAIDPQGIVCAAIAVVEAYNANHGTDLGLKLRVWGGFTAPPWAKNIGGPPIEITGQTLVDHQVFTPQTVGRVWSADYNEAWTSFQQGLAALYDGKAVIRGISNTAGAIASDEPFVPLFSAAPGSSGGTVNQLLQVVGGGYSDAAQRLTLRAGIADYSGWSTTPLDFTFNRFFGIDSGVKDAGDVTFTLAVLQQARNSGRLVQAGNHAVHNPLNNDSLEFVYGQLAADARLVPVIARGSFQTGVPGFITNPTNIQDVYLPLAYAPTSFVNWPNIFALSLSANAGNIELWNIPLQAPQVEGQPPPPPQVVPGFLSAPPRLIQHLATLLADGTAPDTGKPATGPLDFIAPSLVEGAPGTIAFSGTDAVLLASLSARSLYAVTLQSRNNGTLAVANMEGVVFGPRHGRTLSFAGTLDQVNTVLASLTVELASGETRDVVDVRARDSHGHRTGRSIGVELSSSALVAGAGDVEGVQSGGLAGAAALAAAGILVVGGVQSSLVVSSGLTIGSGGAYDTLLAALAPGAYSTANLTVSGALDVTAGGTAHFTGSLLTPGGITVHNGGLVSGDGALGGGSIVNNGTIEAATDATLGLQKLTVTEALSGDGTLLIDPGATLVLAQGAGSGQTVRFVPNSTAQFSNDPYSPSTLVLGTPGALPGLITGFSAADRLVLVGVAATSASYDSASATLTVEQTGGAPITIALSGYTISGSTTSLTGLVASVGAGNIISFVAPTPAGVAPSIVAPAALQGAFGTNGGIAIGVPDIVVAAPLPALLPGSPADDPSHSVRLTAPGGVLTADLFGYPPATVSGSRIMLSGTLGEIERALQTLTYTANAVATDRIEILVDGVSSAGIDVYMDAPGQTFTWQRAGTGLFGDAGNWTPQASSSHATPPGGGNTALFGQGTYAVTGNGAVGEIVVRGRATMTGEVTAQSTGEALAIEDGGALTLAGGAQLFSDGQAIVGRASDGLLALMGGALSTDSLVIGGAAGVVGTVVNLHQITATGAVIVGASGTGTLDLLGVAATVLDSGAVVGKEAGAHGIVTVNGGLWESTGQLIVGLLGNGSLFINGMANGITGQVAAWDATIGAQSGSQGSVTLDGGAMLVADGDGTFSTLTVGEVGDGVLSLADGSEVAVGVALAMMTDYNGQLNVGQFAGGSGQIDIGGDSELLVYGSAEIGGEEGGTGAVTVGLDADDIALFSLLGTLEINGSGQVALGGAGATVRAGVIDVDSGGLIAGAGTLSGLGGGNGTVTFTTIVNDGVITAQGGNLLLYGSVTGEGSLTVADGATLTLQTTVVAGQVVTFGADADAGVVLNDARSFSGTIAGFGSGDVLDLASIEASSATWSQGVLTLHTNGASLSLNVAGTYAAGAFAVHSDGHGGTEVVLAGGGQGAGQGAEWGAGFSAPAPDVVEGTPATDGAAGRRAARPPAVRVPGDGTKPPQVGLVDMGNIAFYNTAPDYAPAPFSTEDLTGFDGLFSEMVLNLTWEQLQPTQGGTIDPQGLIAAAIGEVETYNSTHDATLGLKLRVWGGFTAPAWAKYIGGPPITITGMMTVDPESYGPQTTGRYWSGDYIEAWTDFQQGLAALWDGHAVIRGISNTAGALASDEPFVPLFTSAPVSSGAASCDTVNQLLQVVGGGYSEAAQKLTLRAGIADYADWSTTPLDFTMNLFNGIATGTYRSDQNVTLAVLQQARNSSRTVQAGNHALRNPLYAADAFLYAQMGAAASLDPSTAPGSFQTGSPFILDGYWNWPTVVAQGVTANAGNIELWNFPGNTGFQGAPSGEIEALYRILARGTAPLTDKPADGSALGFVAPGFVASDSGTVTFSGTDAVLLASAFTDGLYAVTLQSTTGGTLVVTDVDGIMVGPTSGHIISLAGTLDQVNTVLASLTDTPVAGQDQDVVFVLAADSFGNLETRNVGVQLSAPAPLAGAGVANANAPAAAGQSIGNGILVVGGVGSSVTSSSLTIGGGGTAPTTLLAALAPSLYSTASLDIAGALDVLSGGTAFFTGALEAGSVTVATSGAIVGAGTLAAASAGPIVNLGTIEASVDNTLGLGRLTVGNDVAGTGTLVVDPGAALILTGAVAAGQTIRFAAGSIAQFANDPYAPSTLVLADPFAMDGAVAGFSFADWLVLENATGATWTPDAPPPGPPPAVTSGTLTVTGPGGSNSFSLSGENFGGLVPQFTAADASPLGQPIFTFVAPSSGQAPSLALPSALQGTAGTAVLVPGIVLLAPLPAPPPSPEPAPPEPTYTLKLTAQAAGSVLSAVLFPPPLPPALPTVLTGNTITVTGTRGEVERTLQTLTYKAADVTADRIEILVDGVASAGIAVFTDAPPSTFVWKPAGTGQFGNAANWAPQLSPSRETPPGGGNTAVFGTGTYTVTGDGAVGGIIVTGTTTMTGQVTAQSTVDIGGSGALTLAGGGRLSAVGQVNVGGGSDGLLALMGGALATQGNLLIGGNAGVAGTVVNLEVIHASGTVTVGDQGIGALQLLGVAASLVDAAAVVGQASGGQGTVAVNGGQWDTTGLLTVGDYGTGSLLIDGRANGITGQVIAFDATIGAQSLSHGSVALDGGEMLVANGAANSSTLIVGGSGDGLLMLDHDSEVAVGVALAEVTNNGVTEIVNNNGVLVVGQNSNARGRIFISGSSGLLVYGAATVGGAAGAADGTGQVRVGLSADDVALFSLLGTLTVNGTGQVALGGAGATVRAGAVSIAAGGQLSGAGTLSGLGGGNGTVMFTSIDNDGSIAASGGNLLLYGGVDGVGTLSVGSGATLTLQSAVGVHQTLSFGRNSTVVLNDLGSFAGKMTGFDGDDRIDIAGTEVTGASWSGGVLTLDTGIEPFYLHLAAPPGGTGAIFTTHSDGNGGTYIAMAGGWGDVHMTTFNGLLYDFQAVGDFVAVRSTGAEDPWQFQIRTGTFPGATSITTELAAALGGTRVTFAIDRDNPVYVDGVSDAMTVGEVQQFAGGTLRQLSGVIWQVTWNAGQSVTVTDVGPYLDWTVGLGPQDGPGSVQGLLGSKGAPGTDFQLPDGTVLEAPSDADILGLFADAWRVGPETSLLDDTFGTARPAAAISPETALFVQLIAAEGGTAMAGPPGPADAASSHALGLVPAFAPNSLLHG